MKRLRVLTRSTLCILALAAGLLPSLAFAQIDPAWPGYDPHRPVQLLGIPHAEPAADHADVNVSDGQESEDDKTEGDSARVVEDLKKRLEKLEESWNEQQEAETKAKAEKTKEPTFEIGGRIHLDTWSFLDDSQGIHWFENPETGVDPENRALFRRIRLEIQGDVFETMLYRLQVDFNEPANPEIKDVYIGWDELPGNHTVIFGNHKRPLGLDHLNSSRFNVFAERPLVIEAFNEDARRLGLSATGHTDDEVNHWQFGLYHLENVAETGRVIGDSRQMSGNARFWSSPWYDESSGGRGYLHWAAAGMIARPDGDVDPSDSNDNLGRFRTRSEVRSDSRWLDTGPIPGAEWYEIGALEAMLNIGSLQVVGEYQHAWMQRGPSRYGTGPDLNFHGGYVYAAWLLTGEHVPYDRDSGTVGRVRPFENFFLVERCRGGCGGGWGAWQLKARWSYLDLTDHNVEGGAGQNVTVGLNWWWTSHSRLQVDLTRGEIDNHRPVADFTAGDFWALGTRAMVDF